MNVVSTSIDCTCASENDNAHIVLVNFPNDKSSRLWIRNCCSAELGMKSNDKLHLNCYVCYNYTEDCCYISKTDSVAFAEQDAVLMCKTQIPLERDNVTDAFNTKAQGEVTYDVARTHCNTNTDVNQFQNASVYFSDLCRICGESASDGIGIHTGKGLEVLLKDKINLYMPILVDQKDIIMPQKVCIGCYNKLDTVHSLAVTCLRTDMKLRKLLRVNQKTEYAGKCGTLIKECWLKLAEEIHTEGNAPTPSHFSSQNISQLLNSHNVEKFAFANDSDNSSQKSILVVTAKNAVHNSSLDITDNNSVELTNGIAHVDNEMNIERVFSKNRDTGSTQASTTFLANQHTQLRNDEEPFQRKVTDDDHATKCTRKEIIAHAEASTNTRRVKNAVHNLALDIIDNSPVEMTNGIARVDNEMNIEKVISKNENTACTEASAALLANQQKQLRNDEEPFQCTVTGIIYTDSSPSVKGTLDAEQELARTSENSNLQHLCVTDDCASKCTREEIIENAETSNTRCGYCQVIYPTGRDLASHVAKCHYGVFKCFACDRTYEKWSSLDIHVATHGVARPYLCDLCGKGFKHANNLRGHKRTHLEESRKKRHVCGQCGSGFRSRFHLREHMHQHEGTKPYACEDCGKAFYKRIQLRQHKLSHGTKKHACPLCGVAFNRRGNMSAHLKRHVHGDGVYTCSVCAHRCDTMSELKFHRKNHSDAEIVRNMQENSSKKTIWQCQICSRVFSKRSVLEHHDQRVHVSAEKRVGSVECNECGKKLASKSSLLYHRKSVHLKDKAHVCQYCGKDFVSRESRLNHERLHTGERPYVCVVCNARYRCSSILSQHMKIHSTVRPHACNYCGKGFTRKSAVDVHERTHTGVKPFSCRVCDASFCQKGDMLKHAKTHTSKRFQCKQCDEIFRVKKDLLTHVRGLHVGTCADNSSQVIN